MTKMNQRTLAGLLVSVLLMGASAAAARDLVLANEGGLLDYLPVSFAHAGPTADHASRTARLLDSFAAPYSIVTDGRGGGGGSTLYGAAAAHGLPALTTELGGGHGLSPQGVNIGLAGVLRVLRDFGVVPGLEAPPAKPSRRLAMLPPETTIYARAHGLLEPSVGPGTQVGTGDLAGMLHPLDDPAAPPQPLTFSASGIVVFQRHPTLTAPGDALFGLASEISEDQPPVEPIGSSGLNSPKNS